MPAHRIGRRRTRQFAFGPQPLQLPENGPGSRWDRIRHRFEAQDTGTGPAAVLGGRCDNPEANDEPASAPERAGEEAADGQVTPSGPDTGVLSGSRWQGVQRYEEEEERLGKLLRRADWGKHWGGQVAEVLDGQGLKEAGKIAGCSTWLMFRKWTRSGTVRLRKANFCQLHKLCAGCARARAGRNLRAVVPELGRLLGELDVLPLLVTLTIPTGPDLLVQFDRMAEVMGQLVQRRRNSLKPGSRVRSELAKIRAALWHFEVKRSEGNRAHWHVHVHGLVLRDRGRLFDLDALKAEVGRISGDPNGIDIAFTEAAKMMTRRGVRFPELAGEERRTVVGAVLEVCKYQLKFGDLTPADAVHVWQQTRGRKFVRRWDGFRGFGELDADGDLSDEDGPYLDLVYRWLGEQQGYGRTAVMGRTAEPEEPTPIDPAECPF